MNLKSFFTVFIILIFISNPVSAIIYSGVSPSNGSTITTTDVPFTISYTGVSSVEANTGILSIEIGSTYVNYTVDQTGNTTANITRGLSSNTEYNYKWYFNDSNTIEESGIYRFKVGMFAGITDIIYSIPTMIPAIFNIVIWVSIIGIVILIVGIIKGWFKKGGILSDILKKGGIK